MNQKIWVIITSILGFLLLVSFVFLALFGVRLSKENKIKEKEIASNLSNQEDQLKATFQSQLEQTLTTYTADEVFGSFSFSYPKVWATYVKQDKKAKQALVFLADPNMVVFDEDVSGPYTALRVVVYNNPYESMLKDIRSNHSSKTKYPYSETAITISGISGQKYLGKDKDSGKNISFVLVPLRDKTLYIGTDNNDKYSKNLETIIKSFNISK